MRTFHRGLGLLFMLGLLVAASDRSLADQPAAAWRIGFAKVDVTPTEPVRMAGYGNRDRPSEGVDTPLFVRCMAIDSTADDATPSVLVSIDTIGLPGSLTATLSQRIEDQHGIPRQQIVMCSTHTHCGPDLVSELSNIFATPLSDEEKAAGLRYKDQLSQAVIAAVTAAIADMQPANLAYAIGSADFAANRRVLTDGRWSGFGVQPDGPVDHRVPVLQVTDPAGKLRGVIFNYACHCTTMGGDYYRINAEWAGYACQHLESDHPQAVAMCTIGCGADANPEPRGSVDTAKVHGRTLAAEVQRVIKQPMQPITADLESRFDYAGLSFELPTKEELQQRLQSGDPQTRRHAQQMLDTLQAHGRLPATYPVPMQSWKFGDQLTMIFLGGEVVVDYALRLMKELDDPQLWVTAYAGDVLGYIASERLRSEGGYEYDRSGIYYGLPGPWAAGTEDLLIRRIQEMLRSRGRSQPQDPDKALNSFDLPDDFQIDLVAAEPLVTDPINLAFAADGSLWIVEMGGYPNSEQLGRIKRLTDRDGDGRYETATEFLSGLSFPTGVMPWGDGVLVAHAPDILWVRDTDGDGVADHTESLLSGFPLANQQHRVNGFTYGLDHSLHLASGDNLGDITSVRSGQTLQASGHDLQFWPDTGRLELTAGRTQFIRSRSDWGDWFGNDNSRPMYQYPIDARYLRRNPHATIATHLQELFDPPVAPPVYPRTPSTERFNDLFAANRFTSACSAIVARSPHFARPDQQTILICEPVHNLVHRSQLTPQGVSFRAERFATETDREFLASNDPWFRPVRAAIGPDGMLYVVDMYRETIEHPEWIPESWQAQLNLRAGSDRGRVYRISPHGYRGQPMPRFDQMTTAELVDAIRSPVGTARDLAQQQLIQQSDPAAIEPLRSLAQNPNHPQGRVHALAILRHHDQLDPQTLAAALHSSHPGVLMVAIRLTEPVLDNQPDLIDALSVCARHDDPRVVMQTALTLGETSDPAAAELLASIADRMGSDAWIARAISSSATPHATTILNRWLPRVIARGELDAITRVLLADLLRTAGATGTNTTETLAAAISDDKVDVSSRLNIAAVFASVVDTDASSQPELAETLRPLHRQAIELLHDQDADPDRRSAALPLIGIGIAPAEQETALLLDLVAPHTPSTLQLAVIDRLAEFAGIAAADGLFSRWSTMTHLVRQHCVSRALERPQWTETLLTALEAGEVRVAELSTAARQTLNQTGSRSMRVRAQRVTETGHGGEKETLVRHYLAHADADPQIDHGSALFRKHCAVCHVGDSQGEVIGASLQNLTDRSRQALATAILDPNRAADPKYLSYAIQTTDGRILAGAIEQESGQSVTLVHADGRRSIIRREQIESINNSGISLMPEGFESVLSPGDLHDLIGYLQTAVKLDSP